MTGQECQGHPAAHGMPYNPQSLSVPAGERGLPLYKLLKMIDFFYWTDETQKVLDDLKAIIYNPPVLASPEPGEALILYVMATAQVISAALVVEREEPGHVYKVQRSVYYISKVLSDYETCYN
jgi:hypothetical protein